MHVWLWPLVAAPFVGSFLGVLIRRLPQGRPVGVVRSACKTCGTFHPAVELAAIGVATNAVIAVPDDPAPLSLVRLLSRLDVAGAGLD